MDEIEWPSTCPECGRERESCDEECDQGMRQRAFFKTLNILDPKGEHVSVWVDE